MEVKRERKGGGGRWEFFLFCKGGIAKGGEKKETAPSNPTGKKYFLRFTDVLQSDKIPLLFAGAGQKRRHKLESLSIFTFFSITASRVRTSQQRSFEKSYEGGGRKIHCLSLHKTLSA